MKKYKNFFLTISLFLFLFILGCEGCNTNSFPDENSTGPHGTLAPYTGSTSLYDDGTVIENVEIHLTGNFYVNAKNIIFRNVRVIYAGDLNATWTMFNTTANADNLLFEECEIDGKDRVARAISGICKNLVVRRCNIHNTGNGVEINDSFTVEDCYLHDIFTPEGQNWHCDGIQAGGGTIRNITVRHNTILLTGNETGCININGGNDPATANVENVLIENNLIGGGGYSMYTGSQGTLSNYLVINNKFTTRIHQKVGYYNIWYPFNTPPTKNGNTIFETGEPADDLE